MQMIPLNRYKPSQTLLQQAINAKWYHTKKLRSPNETVYLYLEYGHDYNKSLPSELIKMAKKHSQYTMNMRLRDAADIAKISKMIMISASCMQWQRLKAANDANRVHRIGSFKYVFLKYDEITENECIKHLNYLKEMFDYDSRSY